MDLTIFGFDVKCRLIELIANLVHRLEGIVLEDFLADLVPDIFLISGLRRRVQWLEATVPREPAYGAPLPQKPADQ
jgi:hypothetical protein